MPDVEIEAEEEESENEESEYSEDNEYPEDNDYPEENEHLEDNEYPGDNVKVNLEEYLEDNEYTLEDNEYPNEENEYPNEENEYLEEIEEVYSDNEGPNYSNAFCKATGHSDLQVDFPAEKDYKFKCLPKYSCDFSTTSDEVYMEHFQTVHLHQEKYPKALCPGTCCPGPSNSSGCKYQTKAMKKKQEVHCYSAVCRKGDPKKVKRSRK